MDIAEFWEKEQTKADVVAVILDEVCAKLPSPPFAAEEKKLAAGNLYAHVWQQAKSGGLAKAA
jgi:type I restriction enzyme, R subunit